jgi:ABC-type branched-subunit amino acid transport system permease subunit
MHTFLYQYLLDLFMASHRNLCGLEIVHSRFGRAMMAIRDDETALRFWVFPDEI